MHVTDHPKATRATARLPGLDIEIVHQMSPDGTAEHISINLLGMPSFAAFGRFLEAANPMAFWMQAARMAWAPWLGLGAANAALLPDMARRLPMADDEAPPAETARVETPRVETADVETPAESPRVETARVEPPAETPRAAVPHAETAPADAPRPSEPPSDPKPVSASRRTAERERRPRKR
jgi:hypothetical protein